MFVPSEDMTDEKAREVAREVLAQVIALENYYMANGSPLAGHADAAGSALVGIVTAGEPEPVTPF